MSRRRRTIRILVAGVGDIPFYHFTAEGIDRMTAGTNARIAEKLNSQSIDFLYEQAMSNWELNGRRGAEPVRAAYHETDPDKIFQHLQAFRYGNVAVPDDGSGYLTDQGYVAASPWQQQYTGAPATQLTAYNGGQYNQVAMPDKPATPLTSDIFWGSATEHLKPSGTQVGTNPAPRATPGAKPPSGSTPPGSTPQPSGSTPPSSTPPSGSTPPAVQDVIRWAKANPFQAVAAGVAIVILIGGNR